MIPLCLKSTGLFKQVLKLSFQMPRYLKICLALRLKSMAEVALFDTVVSDKKKQS